MRRFIVSAVAASAGIGSLLLPVPVSAEDASTQQQKNDAYDDAWKRAAEIYGMPVNGETYDIDQLSGKNEKEVDFSNAKKYDLVNCLSG